MSQDLIQLNNAGGALAIPDYLKGADLNVSQGLLATAGLGGNRIGLKGNRFRIIVNGKEESIVEQTFLDVIVLGAVPHISRIFYEGQYVQDEKASPTCYSADGIAPPDDVKNKQSTKCDICPQNQKGSKVVNGQKIKACGFFQRLIVMIAGDPEGLEFQLDVKSMGIFGESHANVNKFNIRDYTKLLTNRGADIATVVTRLTFDTDSSVPKLLFSAAGFISPQDYEVVREKVNSDTVKNMLKINMTTVDLSGEVDAAPAESVADVVAQTEQVTEVEVAGPGPAVTKADTQTTAALIMTEKAGDITYEDFIANEWDDETLIAEGYAKRPTPPKPPAAPPKPTVPAKPSTVPAKPATTPAPANVQRRPPGRPPGSGNKPATAPAAAQTATAAAPAPATQRVAPAPTQRVPTVTKAHPVPAPQAETVVQETATDADVAALLDSLE